MSRFLALLLVGMVSPALAGGTATIQGTGPGPSGEDVEHTMTVTWQDEDTVRLEPDGQPAYMLVRGDNSYSVTSAGGQMMVIDMGAMMSMAQSAGGGVMAGGAGPKAPTVADAQSVSRIEPTGAEETVAGITGKVYEIHWTDSDGASHVDEAVLSNDDLLRDMTVAFQAFGKALGGEEATHPLNQALSSRGLGALRFGDRFKVISISDETPPDDHFELPAEPMQLGTGLGQF